MDGNTNRNTNKKTIAKILGAILVIAYITIMVIRFLDEDGTDSIGNTGSTTVQNTIATESSTSSEDKPDIETYDDSTDVISDEDTIDDDVIEIVDEQQYYFRNDTLLTQHFEKHGIEMGFDSKESYEAAASKVVTNPDALHKIEAEDGDDVYYLEETNEFVIVSGDGYIRTYFLPSGGKKYFDKQ